MEKSMKRQIKRHSSILVVMMVITTFFFGPTLHKASAFHSPAKAAKNISKAVRMNTRAALKPVLQIDSKYAKPIKKMFSDNATDQLAAVDKDNHIDFWDLTTGQRISRIQSSDNVLLIFFQSNKQAVILYENGLSQLYDTALDNIVWNKNLKIENIKFAFINQNDLWIINEKNVLNLFDKNNLQKISKTDHSPDLENASRLFFDNRSRLLVYSDEHNVIRIWDAHLKKPLLEQNMGSDIKIIGNLHLANNLLCVQYAVKKGFFSHETGLEIFDITTRKIKAKTSLSDNAPVQWASPNREVVIYSQLNNIYSISLKNGETTLLGRHDQKINQIVAFRENIVLTASKDRTIGFWDIKEKSKKIQIISMNNGWASVSSKGYFDGNLDGDIQQRVDSISWLLHDKQYPLDLFLEKYYIPGLLGKTLQQVPYGKADDTNIVEGFLEPPAIEISGGPLNGDAIQTIAEVNVKAKDNGGGINTLRLFHNGKIISDKTSVEKKTEDITTKTYLVNLLPGDNEFKAQALSNDKIQIDSKKIEIHCTACQKEAPTLHLVLVGINKYQNPWLDLKYGVPGAKEINKSINENSAKLFKNIQVYQHYDRTAKKDPILSSFNDLSKIPPGDTVIIYFAGHGEVYKDKWYFITYDLKDPTDGSSLEKKGISSIQIQDKIKEIGARHVILLLDSCKSGAALDSVFADLDTKRSITLLSYNSGVHIASAASAEQYAWELKILGRTIFSYSITEGINGKADLSPQDGYISVKELLGYIEKEVPQIAMKYIETPQNPIICSRGSNFTIASPR